MRTWIGCVAMAAVLAGCGKGDGASAGTTGATTGGDPAAANKVEVVAFQGGYGIDFYQQAAKEFGSQHKLEIKVDGSPKVWEQLQPRFVSGDVPDLAFPGWGFDHWKAAYEGQLMDLTSVMDEPAGDGKGRWRDNFMPAILKLGEYNGKQYVLPYYVSVEGWWYNPKLFQQNGWQVPKTYEELLALCEKIKAKGIAPITFQGQYPDYMLEGFLVPWILSAGGNQALDDCQALKAGAWKSPAVLTAAKLVADLRSRGYFQQGATGMNHTQSQTEFVQGRAAMIPCGSWLYAEMKDKMPEGAEMEFMLVPGLERGMGDKSAVGIRIEPWMIPAKAKNPKQGIELFKYMTTPDKARQFVEEKGTLMAIQGSASAKLPKHLLAAAQAFTTSKAVWSAEYRSWYKDFNKELEGAMASLLSGELTPEGFCERVEKAAQAARDDEDIVKRTYVR
ncbi:MAG: extracellular solute-binding protein [Fimbriimonadales bacterium]